MLIHFYSILALLFIVPKEPEEPEASKFNAFTGTGRRLDGKPLKYSTASENVSVGSTSQPSNAKTLVTAAVGTSGAAPIKPAGKLVFGAGSAKANVPAKVMYIRNLPSYIIKEKPQHLSLFGFLLEHPSVLKNNITVKGYSMSENQRVLW